MCNAPDLNVAYPDLIVKVVCNPQNKHCIDDMTIHSFISKTQSNYFKDCKENLQNDSCTVILVFAENYQFIVQDEVQAFHRNNGQCSICQALLYYRDREEQSFGIISVPSRQLGGYVIFYLRRTPF